MTSKIPTPDSTPALGPLFAPPELDDRSSHGHRQLIGYLGLGLPFLIWFIAGWRWRPIEGLQRWKLLSSVSAYYYTGAVVVFAGILVALAVFFFTYRGYRNEHNLWDRFFATIAGLAAIGVAFFPTKAPPCWPIPSWWTPEMHWIHFCCAAVLFGAFFVFSFFLFPKSKVKKGESPPFGKRVRNLLYRTCGIFMLVFMGLIVKRNSADEPIFWPETMALAFFAVSGLVKGRADWTLVNAGRRTLHYGRHPGHLVEGVVRAIRG